MSQRPFSWPCRSGPPAGRECLSFPGSHGGASLKEPESKGRKGRRHQSPALFRGVNGAFGKVKSQNDVGTQPQPRARGSMSFLERQPGASTQALPLPTSLLLPQRPLSPARTHMGQSPPLLQVAQDGTGSYQEYRLSQLCPCPDKAIRWPPGGASEKLERTPDLSLP